VFESLIDAKIIIIEEEERYIEKAFDIALTNQLTIYDALYVSQALRWGKLLTSDKQVISCRERWLGRSA
jgi:predicted nucleic acid-binding protein